jgi:hypothetical protein
VTEPATPPNPPRVRPRFWLWVVVGLALLMLVAVLLPNHPAPRYQSAAPIGALKTINSSQTLFREGDKEGDGTLDYGTLAELNDAALIDSALGSGRKDGYVFQVRPSPHTPELLWMAIANPEEPGVTGDRYYVTNQAGIIYYTGSLGSAFELNEACEIPPNTLPVGK